MIRSIEAFLLSFSTPFNDPYAPHQADDDLERARPYIVPTSALCDVLCLSPKTPEEDTAMQTDWSLAELLLCGALEDPAADILSDVARGKQKDVKASRIALGLPVSPTLSCRRVVARSPAAAAPPTTTQTAPSKKDMMRALGERMSLPPTPDEDETESDEPSPIMQTHV